MLNLIIKFVLPQLLFLSFASIGECKVFDKCQLANDLRNKFLVKNTQDIATWVCIASQQSALDSTLIGAGGYYGLFQIGSEFWCDQWTGAKKACGISCNKLIDEDLYDDFQCMQVIFAEHQRISGNGFNAWTSYQKECSNGQRALSYIDGCFDNYITSDPVITQTDPYGIQKSTGDQQFYHHHHRKQPPTVNSFPFNERRWGGDDNNDQNIVKPKALLQRSKPRSAKIYDRCELAQELVFRHSIPMEQVAMWVCIAQHESNFNTSAVGQLNADGSGDHGLFQISDIYWCSPPGKGWACGLSCDKLEDDDISDDVECMQRIYEEHQRLSGDGFNAWTVYSLFCKGRADKYIEGCSVDYQQNEIFPKPGIIAPNHPPSIQDTTRTGQTGKVYDRCTLARELVYQHSIELEKVSKWVCIAQHESNLNTSSVGRLNADGSGDHGLFQISDRYWCSTTGIGNACGISCDKLEDNDITDDVECIKRIYEEHQGISGDGFNAWTVYQPYCSGDVSDYTRGCFSELQETSSHKPGIWQPERPLDNRVEEEVVGRVFSACELAHELMNDHKIDRKDVAMWVCIAQHESNFNTSAIGRLNADGSEDHGLFQISDLYWCDDKPYGCGLPCAKLRDANIADDVMCIRKIHSEHQRLSGDGFSAWTVYNLFCKGRAEQYVDGCGLRGTGHSIFEGFANRTAKDPITSDKYPFFFSQFKTPTTVNPPSTLQNTISTTVTTKKPFYYNFGSSTVASTTAPRTTQSYPRTESITQKETFSSKRPWIQTTTPRIMKNTEKNKIDFSVYDFFLKGFNIGKTTTQRPILAKTTALPSTKKVIVPVHFTIPSTTQKPSSTSWPRFQTTTPKTFSTATQTPKPAFNIFDLYLKRPSVKKNLIIAVDPKKDAIPIKLNPKSIPQFDYKLKVQTSTAKPATTFDPFSVYKINRNNYRNGTTSTTFNWRTTPLPPILTTQMKFQRESARVAPAIYRKPG